MTLEVETGSGSGSSESYASVADADAYQDARGRSLWSTMSTNEKEQALRRATDWMVQEYRARWKGRRVTSTQALDWPRVCVVVDGFAFPSNEVPTGVVRACVEMAFRAASGELNEDQERPVDSETIGPITVNYAPGSSQKKKFPAVDAMLQPLLAVGSGSLRIVRG